MTVRRFFAIGAIFVGAAAAWFTLGTSLVYRTGQFDGSLRREVALLWGGPHVQQAPEAFVARPSETVETVVEKDAGGHDVSRQVRKPSTRWAPAPLTRTDAEVTLDLEQRQKGLLWFDTYTVVFRGSYVFTNPDAVDRRMRIRFAFPAPHAIYDDFTLTVNGQSAPRGGDLAKEVETVADLGPNGQLTVTVGYRSRGLDDWRYAFSPDGVAEARDFVLKARTNVRSVDFPPGTMSPTSRTESGDGWLLTWQFANLVTGQAIGIDLPARQNPGPLAARITFFAPVSLLFFLSVMVVLDVLSRDSLHPMNYVFISAAFFAFHLLLAYLVDHVSIHTAFAAAAFVSAGLVASYLRAVGGMRERWWQAVLAQALYLVAFSYAFFFEGFTGLAVTCGAIVTLFALMQMTARVHWADVFDRGRREATRGGQHAI
ncbi:MAG: inner membrane CreD family protein [Acidobacteriota bacterium]|nr:inner membrane CreD family protein [Acidobacteriota bacterium]